MRARLFWWAGGLAVVAALVVAGEVAAQVAGGALGAGAVFGRWGGRTWYAPWAVLMLRGGGGAARAVMLARAARAGEAVVAAGALVALLMARLALGAREASTYGTARWADRRDLRRAGLLGDAGLVLCQTADARWTRDWKLRRAGAVLRDAGPAHTIVFAPSRSGKGTGLVQPSCVSWTESLLVLDVKRELWDSTAGWRAQFGPVLRFEPTSPDSACYNPLAEIRRGEDEVRDAQTVAHMLVDPSGEKEWDYWQKAGFSLLTAAILHVLYAETDKTLRGVARFLSNPDATPFDTLERMMRTEHLGDRPHPVVAEAAREVANKAEQELSGVFSTATTALTLFRDPKIERATSRSDFRIEDLMRHRHPVSLYLVLPPSDIDRLRPLVRLVLDQIGRRLMESLTPAPGEKRHRLLLLLDEVASLGRLAFLEAGLPVFAGYGIKACLVVQDLVQLNAKYGDKQSLLSNCHVRLTFAANEDVTAERVSKWLGQQTRVTRSLTRSGGAFWKGQVSAGQQEHQRPLLTPGEVMALPESDVLLFVGSAPPYLGRKVRAYADPRFRDRIRLAAPSGEAEARHRLPVEHPWAKTPSGGTP